MEEDCSVLQKTQKEKLTKDGKQQQHGQSTNASVAKLENSRTILGSSVRVKIAANKPLTSQYSDKYDKTDEIKENDVEKTDEAAAKTENEVEKNQKRQNGFDLEASQTNNGESESSDKVGELVYAIADFKPFGINQLPFSEGQAVNILLKQDCNWWWAELDGCHGYVPANHFTSPTDKKLSWQDDEYFGNYSHLKLHQEMLSDKPRTEAYLKAVKDNQPFLKDKVVLDVGCGTGILSMFCAKYGQCKKVYAVEASEFASYTESLIELNGLDDKVTVIQSYVEDVKITEKVDVIISEWMGTFLLFEMMLESVIAARDKFLKPDGVIYPSSAALYFVPCSAENHFNETYGFWGNLYGFDFTLLRDMAVNEYFERPVSDYILETKDCLSTAEKIVSIDMADITVNQLENISSDFCFEIQKAGTMHGFCSWFEVEFPPLAQDAETVILNTGPSERLSLLVYYVKLVSGTNGFYTGYFPWGAPVQHL